MPEGNVARIVRAAAAELIVDEHRPPLFGDRLRDRLKIIVWRARTAVEHHERHRVRDSRGLVQPIPDPASADRAEPLIGSEFHAERHPPPLS